MGFPSQLGPSQDLLRPTGPPESMDLLSQPGPSQDPPRLTEPPEYMDILSQPDPSQDPPRPTEPPESMGFPSHPLVNAKNFEVSEWESPTPYLGFLTQTPEPVSIARDWVVRSASNDCGDEAVLDDEEEGEDLCNCQFSLAYGAKILLNTVNLRLKRGHRCGLCGKNGTGKSTLMRAITKGQVEGFPSPDEVRTFYVEHDIDGSDENATVRLWF
jgi:ABC-type multidrug transport system fused ATPase/permease subunit